MSVNRWKGGTGIFGAFVAVLAGVGLLFGGADSTPAEEASNTRGGNVSINIIGAGSGCDVTEVATRALLNRGFTADQFVIGNDQVNWDEPEAHERGEGAFVDETPRSATEVIDQLKADEESARAAKASLLTTSGATEDELLGQSNWVPAQFTSAVELPGNTGFSGGEAQSVGTRQSDAGEVVWLFVNPEACPEIQLAASNGDEEKVNELAEEATTAHRAGCGNPQTELPVPPKDAPPPPTSTTKPPPTTSTTKPPPTTSTTTPPPSTTVKPRQNFDCQQNGTGAPGEPCDSDERQDPQHNPGQNTGPTPGAPSQPHTPPPGPPPQENTPAPPPNNGGYDSGSPDGSGTPGGSTCDTSGCSGGGSTPPASGTPPTVDDGTHGGDPGGF